jgi:hypothetical protein
MHDEYTSARIARIAARGLEDPASLTLEEIRAVCGSALTQARSHTPPPLTNAFMQDMFWAQRRPVDVSKTIAGNALRSAKEPPNTLAELLRRGR